MLKAKKDTKDLAQIIKITLQGKITSLSAQKDDGEEEKRRERKKMKGTRTTRGNKRVQKTINRKQLTTK